MLRQFIGKISTVNLPDAVPLGGPYEDGVTSTAGLQNHVI